MPKFKNLYSMTKEIVNEIIKAKEEKLNMGIFKAGGLFILEEIVPPSKYNFYIEHTIRNLKEKIAYILSQKVKKKEINSEMLKFTLRVYLMSEKQIKSKNIIVTKWLIGIDY